MTDQKFIMLSCTPLELQYLQACLLEYKDNKGWAVAPVMDRLTDTLASAIESDDSVSVNVTPDFRRVLHSLDGDVSDIVGAMDRLFSYLHKIVREHGGQLHRRDYTTCSECFAEEQKLLEQYHPNWRAEAGEVGCCSLCVKRGIAFYRKQAKQAKKNPIVQEQEQGHASSIQASEQSSDQSNASGEDSAG